MNPERIELVENAVRVCLFLEARWVKVATIVERITSVTPQHVRSVLERLREDGEVMQRKYNNMAQYLWVGPTLDNTELLKVPAEVPAPQEILFKTPSRTYVNGAMPNGDVSYWKAQTSWGRA